MTDVIATLKWTKIDGENGEIASRNKYGNVKEHLRTLLKDSTLSEIEICGTYEVPIITLIKIEDKWEVRWRDFE